MARKKRVRADICPELKKELKYRAIEQECSLSEASRLLAEDLKELKRKGKKDFRFEL